MKPLHLTFLLAIGMHCHSIMDAKAAIHHGMAVSNRSVYVNHPPGLSCESMRNAVWKDGRAMAAVQLPVVDIRATRSEGTGNPAPLYIHKAKGNSKIDCRSLYRVLGNPREWLVTANLPAVTITADGKNLKTQYRFDAAFGSFPSSITAYRGMASAFLYLFGL